MPELNPFEEIFGGCPHGGLKPYCPSCAGDELEEKWAKRREKRESRKTEEALQREVVSQSQALDAAEAEIRRLRWRLEATGK
jgi:hypothetical protein